MKLSRQLLILGLGLILGLTLSAASHVLAGKQGDGGGDKTLPLEELRAFSEVFGKVKAGYVEEVDDKKMLEDAISGLLAGLDPHSAYLKPEDYKNIQIGTTGQFGGLGIEVTMEDGFVKVVSPIDDTPAQRAGIEAGDIFIRLDEKPVKGMSLTEAVKMMRGIPGTTITLTVVREGTDRPLIIEVTRAIIKVRSVKSRTLEEGYGYLRVTNFQNHTPQHVATAVSKLKEESNGDLRGLVLDLRNNPGGVLGAAVGVSDAFLEKGLIVYTEGRSKRAELKYNATPEDLIHGAPLIVLINAGSASASEIVAGALQDHKRAVIMGSQSFGKGSVQTIFPMSNDAAVKMTTARYYTPAGRSIQAEGIRPDIEVEPLKVAKPKSSGLKPVTEAQLEGHLKNGNGKEEPKEDKEQKEKKGEIKESLASKDFVLSQALNLLKGLNILQAVNR